MQLQCSLIYGESRQILYTRQDEGQEQTEGSGDQMQRTRYFNQVNNQSQNPDSDVLNKGLVSLGECTLSVRSQFVCM